MGVLMWPPPGLLLPGWAFPAGRLSRFQSDLQTAVIGSEFVDPLADIISRVQSLTWNGHLDPWGLRKGACQIPRSMASSCIS